jgi:hypothetical protein
MSEPHGQVRIEIPASDKVDRMTVLSSGREVEQGARSMLILAEGLFRLDVIPHDDTIQTVLRNLSPAPRAEMRFRPVGGGSLVLAGPRVIAAPTTGRFGGEVVLIAEDGSERPVAKVLVGSVCHIERGETSFTAQATLI